MISEERLVWPTIGPYAVVSDGGGLIVGAGESRPDYLARINSTGEVDWQIKFEDNVVTSNVDIIEDDGIVIVGNKLTDTDGAETIVTTLNGDIKWQHKLRSPNESYRVLGDPIVTSNHIYIPYLIGSSSIVVKKFRKEGDGEELDSKEISPEEGVGGNTVLFSADGQIVLSKVTPNSSGETSVSFRIFGFPDIDLVNEHTLNDVHYNKLLQLSSSDFLFYSNFFDELQYITST
ncbi:hypothetical protein Hrd1104_05015 [Halorhabdus sp. CBA1104]|uniref:hypothetical protein n=1 Tax=Halorhabdus sp. CBA1104 TaxID=1380432 RepID=UPI0012B31AAA|nr:hypothetical protein [Halorhabdus sp. CBA1104]QGN06713.1 hypothetical protein Hrd1104_05015 [Halorhabdus sp. CBA1104]